MTAQLAVVSVKGRTVSMAARLSSVWLIVASSLLGEGQPLVYNVGDEAEVPCQPVHPGSLHRVKFFKAGISTNIYW